MTREMGRSASHDDSDVDTAGDGQVATSTGAPGFEIESAASFHQQASPEGNADAVHGRRESGSGDGDDGVVLKEEFRAFKRDFECCVVITIADEPVGHDMGIAIHGAADWYAILLKPVSPQVLNRGEPPGLHHHDMS